jgi:LysR family glycine cleavage system transcriptional activator
MHRLRRSLPSLTALIGFEAAARHGSFTRAADELGVTQAAISRRIAALEQDVGSPLFDRRNRRVYLTEAGQQLFATASAAFHDLAETVDRLREPGMKLTITVSIAFAHFRLLPMLSLFRQAEPDIDLRVISEDSWTAPDDPQIDLAVRYGKPPFRGMQVIESLGETLVPVCAPQLAARLGPTTFADLATRPDMTRIDSTSPEPSWLNWAGYLRQSGWRGAFEAPRLRFSSYSDAAYAAIDGEGIALGWTQLLERPLADGRLVALPLAPLVPKERYYILVPDRKPPSPSVEIFARWLAAPHTNDAAIL